VDPGVANASGGLAIALVWLAGSALMNVPSRRLRRSARIAVLALLVLAVAVTMSVSAELLTQPGPFQIWRLGIDTPLLKSASA
jgi:hypothetical protein